MERLPFWVVSISILLFIYSVNSEEDGIKVSLIGFLRKLAPDNATIDESLGWKTSSDPCSGGWSGVTCNDRTNSIRIIDLEALGLDGSIDASLLCKARSLAVLSLRNNKLQGEIPSEISNCSQVTHLFVSGNRLSGSLPSSLPDLNNLKRFDISNNDFSGELPDLPKISGLLTFLAQNNRLNGTIPQFDFANLQQFNVSNNNFTGPVPEVGDRFNQTSFLGNSGLCGKPLASACPPTTSPQAKPKSRTGEKAIMYSGYIVLGLLLILFVAYMIYKKKTNVKKVDVKKKESDISKKPNISSSSYKIRTGRSEYSIISSTESAAMSSTSSLVVLKNTVMKELRFEDLLKAPAELLGRGRFGSLYKVMVEDGNALVVKRISGWTMISGEDFRRRMERMDGVKHPNVLSLVAFYCSKQEKLVVYEYQKNGSLFKLLHGSHSGQIFDWGSRLNVAARLSEGLAFLHKELHEDQIGHGNLKSSNIMMDKNMDPCISEYGLMEIDNQTAPTLRDGVSRNKATDTLKADVFSFGVILLELLTGKAVQNNGFDLARWVHSVVREEWTVEVFDKALLSADDASEEEMVHLLQVALKCVDPSPDAQPSMNEVASMINAIKDEEERSIVSET